MLESSFPHKVSYPRSPAIARGFLFIIPGAAGRLAKHPTATCHKRTGERRAPQPPEGPGAGSDASAHPRLARPGALRSRELPSRQLRSFARVAVCSEIGELVLTGSSGVRSSWQVLTSGGDTKRTRLTSAVTRGVTLNLVLPIANVLKLLISLARPKRFELLTPRFVVWCPIASPKPGWTQTPASGDGATALSLAAGQPDNSGSRELCRPSGIHKPVS